MKGEGLENPDEDHQRTNGNGNWNGRQRGRRYRWWLTSQLASGLRLLRCISGGGGSGCADSEEGSNLPRRAGVHVYTWTVHRTYTSYSSRLTSSKSRVRKKGFQPFVTTCTLSKNRVN
jgi:hypothetical protein